MGGFVWLEELVLGKPSGSFTRRFLVLWPMCGAQSFAQEPIDVDPHHLKADPDGAWICGGSIAPKSVDIAPQTAFRELVLYPFMLNLQSGESVFRLQIAAESEEERTKWMKGFNTLITTILYAQACLDCDQLPFPSVLAGCSPKALSLRNAQLNSKLLQIINKYYSHPAVGSGSLMRVELVNANLTDSHGHLLAALLGGSPGLQVLSLAENFLSSKAMKILAEALGQCAGMTSVNLSNNLLSDSAAEALAGALARMRSLQYLNLSRNRFADACVDILSRDVLSYRSGLVAVDLSYNSFGDALGAAVATLLHNQPATLVSCDVSFCGMTETSFKLIATAIPSCRSLRSLLLEGAFLDPSAMRALVVAIMKHHELHSHAGKTDALVVKFGGIVQDVQSAAGLPFKSLKIALSELQEAAGLKELSLRRHMAIPEGAAACFPVLCFRICTPKLLSTPEEVLLTLSEGLKCDCTQLQMLSFARSDQLGSESEALSFLMFAVLPLSHERSFLQSAVKRDAKAAAIAQVMQSDPLLILQALLDMTKCSHPLLRMLGVRSVYAQFMPEMLPNGVRVSNGDPLTINLAIKLSGCGGKGLQDSYIPTIPTMDIFKEDLDFDYEQWSAAAEDDDKVASRLDQMTLEEKSVEHQRSNDDGDKDDKYETMSEAYGRESKVREDRANSERLVLAVRRLHKIKEISSSVAKFWEGILGNKKYRPFAETELIAAMKSAWMNAPGAASKSVGRQSVLVGSAPANPQELEQLRDVLNGNAVDTHIFPSIAQRQLLCDAMFSRDLLRMQNVLKLMSSHTGGQAYVYGHKLINDIVSLQNTFTNIQTVAKKFSDLGVVEDFLLSCGRVAYTGPEMFKAVELRQELVSTAVELRDNKAIEDLPKIKAKALLTNLLISRDVEALKTQLDHIRNGMYGQDDLTLLSECQVAEKIIRSHGKMQKQLHQAIESRDIDQLDTIIAQSAFSYFYYPELETGINVLNDISRNPALLIKRIVGGLRNNDIPSVEKGFDELAKMGIAHPALDTVICSKIHAFKNRIVQDDIVKDKLVKLCLALRNGLPANSADIAQIYRKALALGLDKDPALGSYFAVISKHAKKLAGVYKQEQYITELLEQNDIVRLNKLLSGRGAGRLVVSFPTAFARDQWHDKLRDVCAGKYHSEVSPNEKDGTIVHTGVFEKAARSTEGVYKGWRRRHFVLTGDHILYYAKPQGEVKGSMRILGGSVRVMDPRELNPHHLSVKSVQDIQTNYTNRLYCLELEEGRDISNISLDLFDEVKKRVRLAKILKIEYLMAQGIVYRSMTVLNKMLSFAQELEVMVDYKLMSNAKQCLMELKEQNLKQELYSASMYVPKNYILKDLLQLSNDCNLDPNLPSLLKIQGLLLKTEVEQELLRAWHFLAICEFVSFIHCMRKLTKVDWSQQNVQHCKLLFIDVIIRFVSLIAGKLLVAGENRFEVNKLYKQALLLCSAYHVETESMDLMRLMMKLNANFEVKQLLTGKQCDNSEDVNVEPTAVAVIADAGHNDIQSFVEELANPVASSQFAINKYPKLRSSAENQKTGGSFSFFNKKKSSKKKIALALEIMTFTANPITKPLLVSDVNDSSVCIEIFNILQVLMTDKPISSLPKPSKSKVIKSQGSLTALLFDVIFAVHSLPAMVDECFFQLCKQVNSNDNVVSCARGWLIMSIYLLCFMPSTEAQAHVKHFIQEQIKQLTVLSNEELALSKHSEDVMEVIDVDSVVVNHMGYSTSSHRYCLRSAEYSLFLLNNHAEYIASMGIGGAEVLADTVQPLAPSKQDILPFLEPMVNQVPIDIEVILMTGAVICIALPFSQLSSPFTILVHLYEALVPAELRQYYSYRQREHATFSASAKKYSDVDQQLIDDYESLFDINHFVNKFTSSSEHGRGSHGSHSASAPTEEELTQQALQFFRNYGLYRVDPGALSGRRDSNQNSQGVFVNLLKLPVQPMAGQFIPWNHNLQFELLNSFVGEKTDESHHKLERMEVCTLRKFVLRNILISPSTERFSSDYELFRNEFSEFEHNQRLLAMKRWLGSDSSLVQKKEDADVKDNNEDVGSHPSDSSEVTVSVLPVDSMRLDMLFAEESRYVNSRLAYINDDHFHYLLGMQLALSWCSHRSNSPANEERVFNYTHSVSACYSELPLKQITKFNNYKEHQLVTIQNHLHNKDGSNESDSSDDSDNDADVNDPQQLQRLQQKYEQMRNARSKYSPHRSIQRKKYFGAVLQVGANQRSPAESDASDGDDEDDEDDFNSKWRPRAVRPDQPLSADDLQHMHFLLDMLGVQYQAGEDGAQPSVRIDQLWLYIGMFHAVAADGGPESAFFRYLLKRAYHDYFTSITAYVGLHYWEVSFTTVFLDVNMRYESADLTAYVDKFPGPAPVLLALSHYGVYLCDANSWAVLFFAPLFDIQNYEVLDTAGPKRSRGSMSEERQLLLKLHINGLQIGLVAAETNIQQAVRMLGLCTAHTLSALDLSQFAVDGDAIGANGALMKNVYADIYSPKSSLDAQQILVQRYLSRYCPLLPAPPSLDTLPLRLATVHFKPLMNKRQVLLQQRLESLMRDQAMSSLATHARYEKSQEHMHAQSSHINTLNQGDDFEDDDDEAQVTTKAEGKKKTRPTRSIFRDPHSLQARAALQNDRQLSAVAGVVHQQANKFVTKKAPQRNDTLAMSSSIYGGAGPSAIAGMVELPLRLRGSVHVQTSRQVADHVSGHRGKPQLRPPLRAAGSQAFTSYLSVAGAAMDNNSVASTAQLAAGSGDLQPLVQALESRQEAQLAAHHQRRTAGASAIEAEDETEGAEVGKQSMPYLLGVSH